MLVVSKQPVSECVHVLFPRHKRDKYGEEMDQIISKCICIAPFTSNVREGFTYAHRTAPQPTSTLEEEEEKIIKEQMEETLGGAIQ